MNLYEIIRTSNTLLLDAGYLKEEVRQIAESISAYHNSQLIANQSAAVLFPHPSLSAIHKPPYPLRWTITHRPLNYTKTVNDELAWAAALAVTSSYLELTELNPLKPSMLAFVELSSAPISKISNLAQNREQTVGQHDTDI